MNTEIICITDRSGSMTLLREAVVDGFNAFLAEQRAAPGEARMTLVLFNGSSIMPFEAKNIAEVEDLTQQQYAPIGSTALLDAIGIALERQGKRIATEGWADQVIVHINTDGAENCSSMYTHEQIKIMIKHAQDVGGWLFLFQAANQDAFQTGGQYGLSAATTANFSATSAGVQQAYSAASASVTTMRATGSMQAAADVFNDVTDAFKNAPTL